MKVGIYNEPSGTFGGSEYVVAVMAHALAPRHDVEIIHHNERLTTLAPLIELSGLDLGATRLRYVQREHRPDLRTPSGLRTVRERYRAQRQWHAALSEPYDVFVNSTHNVPPFCHAPTGVLLTLFPAENRRNLWPWSAAPEPGDSALKLRMRDAGCNWLWEQRFKSYRHRLSISEYTRRWTKCWWGIDTEILYPPVDTRFEQQPKANLVLSVGRFATYSHSKRQLELMTAYRDMKGHALREWCCYSVGGLNGRAEDHAYFDAVRRMASACGAHVVANIARTELRQLFERAKVFWHAAGYGGAGDANPFEAEHFGIATAEAMAAGAVPVVYDHGGSAEIVEHGRSGYRWRTLEELHEYTARLAADDRLRAEMSDEARQRANRFSRDAFVAAFSRLVP